MSWRQEGLSEFGDSRDSVLKSFTAREVGSLQDLRVWDEEVAGACIMEVVELF